MADARRWYQEAADFGSVQAMMTLADLCDGDERKAWLRRASERGQPLADLRLGVDCEEAGRLHEAAQWYERASADGSLLHAMELLAEVLWRMGRTDDAERWARQAAKAEYASPQVLQLLADMLERRGDLHEVTQWRRQTEKAERMRPRPAPPPEIVTVAVLTAAVAPFVQALATKAGEDGYAATRRMVRWLFRRGRVDKRDRPRHPEDSLLVVEDPDPRLQIAILLSTDTPDEQLRALPDFDIDAVVNDAQRRQAKGIRIRWDEASKSWKAVEQ